MCGNGRLRTVTVAPAGAMVWERSWPVKLRVAELVGGACVSGEVALPTEDHGLATVLGSDADTGVAGLTLGGGFGYLTRSYGASSDSLVEVDVVTSDGTVRRAAADEDPDLFWALRG